MLQIHDCDENATQVTRLQTREIMKLMEGRHPSLEIKKAELTEVVPRQVKGADKEERVYVRKHLPLQAENCHFL